MFQRKMYEIPRRKKNYCYNSHLLEHNIFNTFDDREKLNQASSIEIKPESIEFIKNNSVLNRPNKLNPINIKTALLRQNESFSNKSEIMIRNEHDKTNNHNNYNVLNTEPTVSTNINTNFQSQMAVNRPSSVKVNLNLPPLNTKKLIREKSIQGSLQDMIFDKDNSSKSRNLINQFTSNDKNFVVEKNVKVIKENSFCIEKNNSSSKNFDINNEKENMTFIERNILKPNYPQRVMRIKRDIEKEDYKNKNYINNVLAVEKEKQKEYEEYLKKNMISVIKKENNYVKKMHISDDKQRCFDEVTHQVSHKPKMQESYYSNEIKDEENNVDEVIKNQENLIKKYYKEYLLNQMVENLENKKTPAGNMKMIDVKKLNFYKSKLKDEKEDKLKINNSHAY